MKSSVKKDFVMPIAVLTIICLVIAGALALTNDVTAPLIEKISQEATQKACIEALPTADGFEQIQLADAPATVKEIYKATNGAGYVFTLVTRGYGGQMKIVCSIDAEGKIVSVQLLEHSETQGIGSRAGTPENTDQYKGKDANLEGVETLTGATKSTKPFKAAVADAFTAYNMLKEG